MRLLVVLLFLVSCASTPKSVLNDFQYGCIYGTVGILPDVESNQVMTYCDRMEKAFRGNEPKEVHLVPGERGGSAIRAKKPVIDI